MSAQSLVEKITATTNERIAEIQTHAADQVRQIEAETIAAVADIETSYAQAREKLVAQTRKAVLSKASQQAKLIIQTARREAFDQIMTAAQTECIGEPVDKAKKQKFEDVRAELELALAKKLS